jgi:phosphatidylserine/phosphatidylglycerophosphate/cardiolipin synthase-like enzyme
MTQPLTDLTVLDQFRASQVSPGYPTDRRRLFVTQDKVQPAILFAVSSASVSQTVAMYSFDDKALVAQLIANYHGLPGGMPTLIVQDQSCHKTPEGTAVAAPLLALRGQPNFRWSVGTSDKGQIMHLKSFVGDGLWTITGSTNWSNSGENDEDNECEFTLGAALAAQLEARIEAIYAWQIANCTQPAT